ncbi:MAG TPA: hypothetical protein VF306_23575 [Pirellulales bacterium]
MTRIVVDSALGRQLAQADVPLQICDEKGLVLGTFTPEPDYEAAERDRPKLSDEELRQRRQGPTYSTEEVLKHLESL